MADHNNNNNNNNNNNDDDINNNLLTPNKQPHKKGFRKIFSEMVRQAKSPKLPRIRSINTSERNNIEEASNLDITNNKDNSQLLAILPRRRVQSTSSTRSLIHRRRQPSLSNKELERIALKYKRTNTTPPPSRRRDEYQTEPSFSNSTQQVIRNSDHLKYKTWSSPPLGLVERLNEGDPFPSSTNNSKTSNKHIVHPSTNSANNYNLAKSKNRPKLYRQQGFNNTEQGRFMKSQSADHANTEQRRFMKSRSIDHATSKTTLDTTFEKSEIQAVVKTEINKVIGHNTKYEEILVQKWSKDICTKVRDHLRLRTGRYIKIVVNSMIGTALLREKEFATCNILSNIQTSDLFVVTVVKSDELFVSVWVLVSP